MKHKHEFQNIRKIRKAARKSSAGAIAVNGKWEKSEKVSKKGGKKR